jgi:polysaccharide export outer membrane protein
VRARRSTDARAGYRIGPDDLLDIRIPDLVEKSSDVGRLGAAQGPTLPTVNEAPTFDRGERVSSRGDIDLPYVGTVHVEGMTTTEAEAALDERLREADLLRKPQASVAVAEYRHGVVAVLGSVERPGLYPLTRPGATLADVIWAAGGASRDAGRVVTFTPVGGGDPLRVDLEHLIQPTGAADAELNPPVEPGDVVSIAPAGNVLVDGWVDKPGSYAVTRGLTVSGAVAAAGGRLFAGDARNVSVRRTLGTNAQEVFTVDLLAVSDGQLPDVPLADGDVVRIPPSWGRVVPWAMWSTAKEMFHIGGSLLLF